MYSFWLVESFWQNFNFSECKYFFFNFVSNNPVNNNPVSNNPKTTNNNIRAILFNTLGNVHIIRNTIFRIFRPPPSPFVTKNRTNPYLFTRLRNKSPNPLPPKLLRIMWTFPCYVLFPSSKFYFGSLTTADMNQDIFQMMT
jgi:hypothetical protein